MKKIYVTWVDDDTTEYENAYDINDRGKWLLFKSNEDGIIHEYSLNTDKVYEIDMIDQEGKDEM